MTTDSTSSFSLDHSRTTAPSTIRRAKIDRPAVTTDAALLLSSLSNRRPYPSTSPPSLHLRGRGVDTLPGNSCFVVSLDPRLQLLRSPPLATGMNVASTPTGPQAADECRDWDDDNNVTPPARHDSKTGDCQSGQGTRAHDGKASADSQELGGAHIQQPNFQFPREDNNHAFTHNASVLPPLATTIAPPPAGRSPRLTPVVAGLHIRTNVEPPTAAYEETPTIYEFPVPSESILQSLTSPISVPGASSSIRSNLSTSSMNSMFSPASGLASPFLAAMSDLTPLPSPLIGASEAPAWLRPGSSASNRSRGSSLDNATPTRQDSGASTRRKKAYGSLMQEAAMANAAAYQQNHPERGGSRDGHGRNRSISEFTPEALSNARQRHVTIGSGELPSLEAQEYHMHRETYLANQRGLTSHPTDKPLPTPPPSSSSTAESDDMEEDQPYLEDGTAAEYMDVHCGLHNKRRRFRQLRQLGQGTFSKVMLATRQRIPANPTPEIEEMLDPHKLVAIKIVEHGPAGGADGERIETGLQREVQMLKSLSHPSLIHLKACESLQTRTLLVLTYCPGGDLFDFASQQRDLLTPQLVQRMFSELVSAVRYLHSQWIVHRDIKLENVLVNLRTADLKNVQDPLTHPTPLVTLTDLGLGRRLPEPPEPPLLTTRCGSEDYAAPEILLGQAYDGRQTDAWALGVLLYALMEGRLPFDAPPGKPDRSRNTHRIARCDWIWCRFGDDDGEWDDTKGKEWAGARPCVEGLLKKVRMGRKSLEEVGEMEWARQGIQVAGGLRIREEDEDEL